MQATGWTTLKSLAWRATRCTRNSSSLISLCVGMNTCHQALYKQAIVSEWDGEDAGHMAAGLILT